MQTFFFIFLYLQKIAPQIAKKADNPPPTPPPTPTPTRHTIGRHSANMEATEHTRHGGASWTVGDGG